MQQHQLKSDYFTIITKPQKRIVQIKFVGDKCQNVQAIINELDCKCDTNDQFKQILIYFYEKIQKLRNQRQFYKQKYSSISQQTQQKSKQAKQLIQALQNENNYFKNQCLKLNEKLRQKHAQQQSQQQQVLNKKSKIQEVFSDYITNQQSLDQLQESQLLDIDIGRQNQNSIELQILRNQKSSQQNYRNKLSLDKQKIKNSLTSKKQNRKNGYEQSKGLREKTQNFIQRNIKNIDLQVLLKKYNIKVSELDIILQQYLQMQKQTHEMFQKQEQKKLFLLARKMQKKIWNKKIKRDIQKIMEVKVKAKYIV